MSGTTILLIILTLARLWIALQLFLTARKSKLNNLYWLAGLFALAVYSLFTPTSDSPLSNYAVFYIGFLAGHFAIHQIEEVGGFAEILAHGRQFQPLTCAVEVSGNDADL